MTVEDSEDSVTEVRDGGGRSPYTLFIVEDVCRRCKTVEASGAQWKRLAGS